MPTPDFYAEKSKHFLPREIYFWVLNALGWFITLSLMAPGADQIKAIDDEQLKQVALAAIWLGHAVIGTLTILVFRYCYYRQRWYLKKFIGSSPLAIAVALGGGFAIALLVVLPADLLVDNDFRIYSEAGTVIIQGVFSVISLVGFEMASVLLVWLLIYLGIEGAVNARSLVVKALALENSLKDARLNALAGQINPHFLFNALNNIRFLIRQDAERAEASLVDLSEILRHSLGSSQQEKVLLTQELAIVERYLSLMKIQMQRRLAYTIQSEGAPMYALVPPMMIQMLVENAIKHGVEQLKDGGRVDIHCAMNADKLCIEVRNSTAVADADTGAVTESSQNLTAAQSPGGKGVGLANIANRLTLLYGDAAQLAMSRQQGEFVVRITLPNEVLA
jgi:anti-sigma regulatory factor (Ser/Thr protein kinase)